MVLIESPMNKEFSEAAKLPHRLSLDKLQTLLEEKLSGSSIHSITLPQPMVSLNKTIHLVNSRLYEIFRKDFAVKLAKRKAVTGKVIREVSEEVKTIRERLRMKVLYNMARAYYSLAKSKSLNINFQSLLKSSELNVPENLNELISIMPKMSKKVIQDTLSSLYILERMKKYTIFSASEPHLDSKRISIFYIDEFGYRKIFQLTEKLASQKLTEFENKDWEPEDCSGMQNMYKVWAKEVKRHALEKYQEFRNKPDKKRSKLLRKSKTNLNYRKVLRKFIRASFEISKEENESGIITLKKDGIEGEKTDHREEDSSRDKIDNLDFFWTSSKSTDFEDVLEEDIHLTSFDDNEFQSEDKRIITTEIEQLEEQADTMLMGDVFTDCYGFPLCGHFLLDRKGRPTRAEDVLRDTACLLVVFARLQDLHSPQVTVIDRYFQVSDYLRRKVALITVSMDDDNLEMALMMRYRHSTSWYTEHRGMLSWFFYLRCQPTSIPTAISLDRTLFPTSSAAVGDLRSFSPEGVVLKWTRTSKQLIPTPLLLSFDQVDVQNVPSETLVVPSSSEANHSSEWDFVLDFHTRFGPQIISQPDSSTGD